MTKQQGDGVMEHLETVEMLEMSVEGLGGMEMRFGWHLMAKRWSGIWFMTVVVSRIHCKNISIYIFGSGLLSLKVGTLW